MTDLNGRDSPVLEETCFQASASTSDASRFEAGQQVGRCIVQELLGSGATGDVYLAEDQELQWTVAIKIAHANATKCQAAINAIINEAAVVVKLKHPGIVAVHQLDRLEDGRPYVVMDYVNGPSLNQVLATEKLSTARTIEILTRVASALHYAHKQGLVHRDIKPANILLDREGKPYVTDFGFALHEDIQRQYAGDVSGTPAYMAPEQVRGEADRLDGRTDIWAVGVILYQMLTGRLPFGGETWGVIADEILSRDPRPPRMIDDRIPAELEAICLKCLSKTPSSRYATAGDLAADFRAAAERKTSRSARKPLHKLSARINLGPLGCGVMVATFALLIAAGIFWTGYRGYLARTDPAHYIAGGEVNSQTHTVAKTSAQARFEAEKGELAMAALQELARKHKAMEERLAVAERQLKEELAAKYAAGAEQRSIATEKQRKAAEQEAIIADLERRLQQAYSEQAEVDLEKRAKTYQSQRDYAMAEKTLLQLLEREKKAHGDIHPDLIGTMESLAALYRRMGQYKNAETIYLKILEIRKQARSEHNPDYASALCNLAQLYQALGDTAQAETLYTLALDITEKTLGTDDPAVAEVQENLASLYRKQGLAKKAETLEKKATRIRAIKR